MNIIILHGIGGKAGIHWQQWLHDELVKEDHNVIMPTLPNADHPDRKIWLAEIKRHMSKLAPKDTVLVAHSLGVPSALDYIEQSTMPIKALISVAGFAYALGTPLNDYYMKERSINFTQVTNKTGQSYVLFGDDDPYVNQDALNDLAHKLDVEPIILPKGGHVNADAGFTELPQVLNIIRRMNNMPPLRSPLN